MEEKICWHCKNVGWIEYKKRVTDLHYLIEYEICNVCHGKGLVGEEAKHQGTKGIPGPKGPYLYDN